MFLNDKSVKLPGNMKTNYLGLLFSAAFVIPGNIAVTQAVVIGQQTVKAEIPNCVAKESNIQRHMDHIIEQGQKHENVFTTIYDRIKAFYQSNLSTQTTVSNYLALTTEADKKKAIVDADIQQLQSMSSFNCTTDGTEEIRAFRQQRTKLKADLQEYRVSIKNLIVAVKSVRNSSNGSAQ